MKLCCEHLTLPAAVKADFMAAAISNGLAPASAIDLERKFLVAQYQAWIFLFRNCTIPNHNPEMRLLFQFFKIIILVTKSHDK